MALPACSYTWQGLVVSAYIPPETLFQQPLQSFFELGCRRLAIARRNCPGMRAKQLDRHGEEQQTDYKSLEVHALHGWPSPMQKGHLCSAAASLA